MKQRLRVLKLRFYQWCGLKLTSNERSEIAYWITRKIKEPTSETLRKVRSGESISVSVSDDLVMSRKQVKESSLMPPSGAQIAWGEEDE